MSDFEATFKSVHREIQPEPELNWRSLFEAEKEAHEKTKKILGNLQLAYDQVYYMYYDLCNRL